MIRTTELEETSKRLPEKFDDFMKRHKQEIIQLYQNEFNSALRLTEECVKRGNIIEANLHLQKARHARDLVKLEKEDLDNFQFYGIYNYAIIQGDHMLLPCFVIGCYHEKKICMAA